MKKFIAGLILGISIGTVTLLFADGYMMGWVVRVETREGLKVECEDPYLWSSVQEIECDGGKIR